MKTIGNVVVACLALGLGMATWSGAAHGQQPRLVRRPELRPQLLPQPRTVRLGIRGHFDFGEGMHVEQVMRRSIASQLGLEPGDVIVSINGRRLRTENDYFRFLSNSGPWLRMTILDARGGGHVEVTTRLPNASDDDHSHDHHHHDHRFPIDG